MIRDVSKVVIDVGDQERAKVFWTETMGFELVQHAPYQGERWLEVRPVAFALTELTAADEEQIGALVKKAVG